MKFPLFIAKRYLFSPGSSNTINIITSIAALGVIIGSMSLFIVLSGFSGLKDFSLEFSTLFDPDLRMTPVRGKTFLLTQKQKDQILQIDGLEGYAEVIQERTFLRYKNKTHNASIKGVSPSYSQIIQTDSILNIGQWLSDNDYKVVIGSGISRLLNVGIEDYQNLLSLIVPKPGKGIPSDLSKAITQQRVVVSGMYNVNEEQNDKYIFTTLHFARQFLNIPEDQVSALEFKLSPGAKTESIRNQLHTIFGEEVSIKNRIQLNDTLYKMLNTEYLAVYLIFTLVLSIALFNVVGSIIMMIIDKTQNIKTLFSLGAPIRQIRTIFLWQGVLMTLLGGGLGLVLGLLLIVCQQKYGLLMITAHLVYPTKITGENIGIVFLTIAILGTVASYIASSRITKNWVKSSV